MDSGRRRRRRYRCRFRCCCGPSSTSMATSSHHVDHLLPLDTVVNYASELLRLSTRQLERERGKRTQHKPERSNLTASDSMAASFEPPFLTNNTHLPMVERRTLGPRLQLSVSFGLIRRMATVHTRDTRTRHMNPRLTHTHKQTIHFGTEKNPLATCRPSQSVGSIDLPMVNLFDQ